MAHTVAQTSLDVRAIWQLIGAIASLGNRWDGYYWEINISIFSLGKNFPIVGSCWSSELTVDIDNLTILKGDFYWTKFSIF